MIYQESLEEMRAGLDPEAFAAAWAAGQAMTLEQAVADTMNEDGG